MCDVSSVISCDLMITSDQNDYLILVIYYQTIVLAHLTKPRVFTGSAFFFFTPDVSLYLNLLHSVVVYNELSHCAHTTKGASNSFISYAVGQMSFVLFLGNLLLRPRSG